MPGRKVVGKDGKPIKIKREKDMLYFVDGAGDLRKKRRKGAK